MSHASRRKLKYITAKGTLAYLAVGEESHRRFAQNKVRESERGPDDPPLLLKSRKYSPHHLVRLTASDLKHVVSNRGERLSPLRTRYKVGGRCILAYPARLCELARQVGSHAARRVCVSETGAWVDGTHVLACTYSHLPSPGTRRAMADKAIVCDRVNPRLANDGDVKFAINAIGRLYPKTALFVQAALSQSDLRRSDLTFG